MFALRDQRAHRRRLQPVTQPHRIRCHCRHPQEIARVLRHHRLVLRIVRHDSIGTGPGTVARQIGLAPILHLAFAFAQIGHDQRLVDDGQPGQ